MTKRTIARFAGIATGAAMVLSFAPVAGAQTVAQLQAQIAALMAQLQSLSGTASAAITSDLTIGSTGSQVVALQNTLVSQGYLVMPAGVAPGYFGSLTAAAVAKWQAAVGLPATGYFGPLSRAKFGGTTGGTTTGGTTTGGTTGSTGGPLTGTAGDITVTERTSGLEDEVLEGEEGVKVLGFEVEADGSDVRVTSVRVELEHEGNGSQRLDRYVDEVCVLMGNTTIGCADADDFSESNDEYTRNIATNAIVRDGDTEQFYVAVSALNNIDSDDLSQDWEVAIGNVRFEDAMGAIITNSDATGLGGNVSETFTFEDLSSAGDIELTVNEEDEEVNDAQTVQADDASDTNDVEILSFNIEGEGSDLSLETLEFAITASGAGVTEIANDFRLMQGNTEVGTVTIDRDDDNGSDGFASSTDTTVWVRVTDLDDDDVMIGDGDEEVFTLVADINDMDGAFTSGDSLSVVLDSADVVAEDENGDNVTDLNGSASSGPIAFASSGVTADLTSSSASSVLNLDSTSSDDQGQFVLRFTVTAFEETAYIPLTAASSTSAASSDVGVAFGMENAATGASVTTGTTTATLSRVSGGTESGGYVRINAGQTATFEMTVYHDAAATGIYRVQMDSIGFNNTANTAPDSEYDTVPASDFESTSIQILN